MLFEVIFLVQMYKLLLYTMRVQVHMAGTVNDLRREYPGWMFGPSLSSGGDKDILVLGSRVPLTFAVSVFALATMVVSIVGLFVLVFFSHIALRGGFYAKDVPETRFLSLLCDALGIYYCAVAVSAIKVSAPGQLYKFLL